MAGRERLNDLRWDGGVPVVQLIVGISFALMVVAWPPIEGDALPVKHIADKLAAGLVAYRDFPVEYPPLGLLHIYLPRLLGGPTDFAYELLFSVVGIVLALATAAVVYWLARRGWAAERPRYAALAFVGMSLAVAPLVVWRFDILPTFLSVVALAAYAARSSGWTGTLLGLGTATKLYPAFLGPVFFLAAIVERRFRSAALLVLFAALTVGLIALEVFLVAGSNAFSYLLYQDERGVEIESIGGGLALLADTLNVAQARIDFDFGAWQVASPVLDSLALPLRVFDLIVLGALVFGAIWTFRRDVRATGTVAPRSIVIYLVAMLLAVIVTNKVFSPQYLVWLLPFVALLPGRQSILLVAILAITTFIYPFRFADLVAMRDYVVLVLNARNLLIVVLYVWVVVPPAAWRALGARISGRCL